MAESPCSRSLSLTVAAVAVALVMFASSSASAQGGFGVRAGVTASPDQFHFGIHYDTGRLFDQLSFRPNLEIGLGSNVTTAAVNVEFAWWFPIKHQPWSVYVGGGPALLVYNHDSDGNGANETDAKPGFNLLIGAAHRRGLFAEAKVGLIDSPDFKFTVGYTWK